MSVNPRQSQFSLRSKLQGMNSVFFFACQGLLKHNFLVFSSAKEPRGLLERNFCWVCAACLSEPRTPLPRTTLNNGPEKKNLFINEQHSQVLTSFFAMIAFVVEYTTRTQQDESAFPFTFFVSVQALLRENNKVKVFIFS